MFGKFLKSRVKLSVPMADVTRASLLADSGSSSLSSWHGLLTWCFLDGTSVLTTSGFLASSVQPTSLPQFCFAPAIGTFHSRMEEGYHLKVLPMLQSLVACQTCFSFNSVQRPLLSDSGPWKPYLLPCCFCLIQSAVRKHPSQLLVQANI